MPASAPVLSVLDLVPVSSGRTRAQALAEMIEAWLVARELNTPDAISQTFDAVFHLNAVEWAQ